MDVPSRQLVYGNWIRKRVLWRLGAACLVAAGLALLPIHPWLRLAAVILFIILFVSLLLPLNAYVAFSPWGGNLQEAFFDRIVERVDGHAAWACLDIGTGNGVLAVKLALKIPEARVTALDYWGDDWEYAKRVCQANARTAGVESSIQFVSGDAAKLDFPDASFDAVVSNLTFHEVKTATDTRDVVAEALRVLKPGGSFVFVDYFFESKLYGAVPALEEFVRGLGVRSHQLVPISQVIPLSPMLRHPKVLGRVGMLTGSK